ncbi:MAG: DMT family transporter [Actinomycetota bacterium]
MNAPTGTLDRTTLTAFLGTVVIGGANFVGVKFSNEELDPLFGAAVRFAVAALIFFAIARLRRMQLPRGRAAAGAVVYGLLSFGLSYGLMYFALIGLTAGTASVVMATVPLVTLALAVLHRQEHFTIHGIVGGLLAVTGIAVISVRSVGGEVPTMYLLAAIAGVVSVAESSVVVKSFPKTDPVTTNAVGMAAGAVALVMGSLIADESWIVPETGRTWAALGWLSVVGSVGLFGLFLFVIKRWTASASVYALTLMPVVAVTLGALLAGETITVEILVGGALVLSAVYVGAIAGLRAQRSTALAPAASDPVEDVMSEASGCIQGAAVSSQAEEEPAIAVT